MHADATARKQGNQRWFQFSIKGLFGMAVFVAIGCGALLRPSPWWTMFLASATILWLLGAVLAIIYGRGSSRAFWVGFAVFGWGYVVMVYGLWSGSFEFLGGRPISDSLFTTQLLRFTYAHHPLLPPTPVAYPSSVAYALLPPIPVQSVPQISATPADPSAGPIGSVPATTAPIASSYNPPPLIASTAPMPAPVVPAFEEFMPSGQWLWTIILAWFGGWLARYFRARSLRLAAPIDPAEPA